MRLWCGMSVKGPEGNEPVEAALLRRALRGRYSIQDEIGAGGMAIVYRALDARHNRSVAIKVFRREITSAIGARRFEREIQLLSSLAHPNILPLFDSGEADGFVYFVMPYIARSLREVLAREKFLTLDVALRYAGEIGEAIDFAHAVGIVHRDIKPENILIEEGHAIVADFGVAKVVDAVGGSDATGSHLVIGTSVYMSPEQGSGDQNVDGRSDIYSLACVMYEMLAGTPPFTGGSAQAIQARKTLENMPSLRTVRANVAPEVERAVQRGLAPIPADRPQSAAEFVAELRSAKPRGWHLGAWMGGAAGVGALLALFLLSQRFGTRPLGASGTRVAVSEFTDRTGNVALASLGFMASDWITEGLQRLPHVSVVPMPAALEASRYLQSGGKMSVSALILGLRHETGADVVIVGSYYRSADSLIIQGRVMDAASGNVMVAVGPIVAAISQPMAAITELRTRLMGYFASASDERASAPDAITSAPPTYETYREFSAGMTSYLNSDFKGALVYFERATRLDSAFAPPLLFTSISLSNLGRYREADSVGHRLELERERLTPYYQDWLEYRLALLGGERPRALAAVRRLAAKAPGSKATYNLAVESLENGYIDNAIRALRSLAPDRGPMRGWVPYWVVLGAAHHLKGDYDAELSVGERARALYSSRLYAFRPSVRALAARGDTRETSLATILREAQLLKDDPYGTTLGALMREGSEEALAHDRPVVADSLRARSVVWYRERVRTHGAPADSLALSALLLSSGRAAEASTLLVGKDSMPQVMELRGLIAANAGRTEEARAIVRHLERNTGPYQFGARDLSRAKILSLLGDTAAALTALEAAISAGHEYDLWLHRAPEFASIRHTARFTILTHRK